MIELLKHCLNEVKNVDGEFAEFGVFKGKTFIKILNFVNSLGKKPYAFDSFIGLDEPTDKDHKLLYPKGRFDIGGKQNFIKRLGSNYSEDDFHVVDGFIPKSLEAYKHLNFAFARVDLDHYYPTKCVLEYLLPRINKRSMILCDDYFVDSGCSAALAYMEFIDEHRDEIEIVTIDGREIVYKRRELNE